MYLRAMTRANYEDILGWFPDEASLVQWGGPDVIFPLDARQLDRMFDEGERLPPARKLWVGEVDGSVAAHCQVALDWRHGVARLSRVCVAPAQRGRRLALPFLSAVVRETFAMPEFERLELNVYT